MKLYAYCVTLTDPQPSSAETGLFDQKVYPITVGAVSAFVSEVVDEAVVITKQSVLTHQHVVSSLLDQTTPLPFRFGTVVTESELVSYLGARQRTLLKKLSSVHGCVEMSIKIIWQKAATDDRANADQGESVENSARGTAFLRKKSAELAGSQELLDEANDIAAWIKNCLDSSARDVRLTVRPSQRLVLAADCLVPRVEIESYNAAVEAARSERLDLHFLTSGPWPPYSFANIDLEFKSHFGVS
jgi:hypothetical protein